MFLKNMKNRNILCVDDEHDVLDSFQRTLAPGPNPFDGLSDIFDSNEFSDELQSGASYNLFLTNSGEEAVEIVKNELSRNNPIAAGFFDMRMPGGIDGYETIRQIRELDPQIICAVVTAHTDRSVQLIRNIFPIEQQDELLYFSKPFSTLELEQTALHMVSSWNIKRAFEEQIQYLEKNEKLELEIGQRKEIEKKLRGQTDFLKHILNSLDHPFYVIDAKDYTIKHANKAAGFGDFIEGKTCYQLTHHSIEPCSGKNDPCTIDEIKKTKKPTIKIHTHYDQENKPHNVEIHAYPVLDKDSNITEIIEYTFDITKRVEMEKDVMESRIAAETANRSQKEFLANMSHEIRTPMNGVLGMTELALNMGIPEKARKYLDLARISAVRLLDVINDILDFSKIEAGKFDIDAISFMLRDMVDSTMKILAFKAHEKDLELLYQIKDNVPDNLIGDPGRLRQVLVNLVGNAVKFTSQGEVVVLIEANDSHESIDCPGDRKSNQIMLHFQVKDTGIGIDLEKQASVFQPFSQADSSTTREFGGTGLGLSISTQLVKLMGGKIWMESTPGKGCIFHFSVPLELQSHTCQAIKLVSETDLANISLLAVDDNATNRLIIKEMLFDKVQELVLVDSGRAALEILRQRPFSAAILDAQMPEMDGFTLAEKIKNEPGLTTPRMIMFTSLGQKGDASRCREIGISAYLMKPASQQEILRTLAEVMGKAVPSKAIDEQTTLITQHSLREAQLKLKILLAEDEEINRVLASAILENEGMELIMAANGRLALEALATKKFDLILMDIQMPEMDGYSATAAIREKEEKTGEHIPIIAMTAHAMKGDRQKCIDAGMDGYVSKPIDIPLLREEIIKVTRKDAAPVRSKPASSLQVNSATPLDYDEFLVHRCNNNSKLVSRLIRVLLEESGPGWLAVAEDALTASDMARLRQLGHSIVGVASNLCAHSLAAAGAELNKLAKENRLEEIPAAMNKIKEVLENIRQWVDQANILS